MRVGAYLERRSYHQGAIGWYAPVGPDCRAAVAMVACKDEGDKLEMREVLRSV
jgi:hypothetical protein